MGFRVDLCGRSGDEPEKIGVVFDSGSTLVDDSGEQMLGTVAWVEMTPDEALELATQLFEMHARHRGYIDAPKPTPEEPEALAARKPGTLSVEDWRLLRLLDAGYSYELADWIARDLR